jgi:hypothetical protein
MNDTAKTYPPLFSSPRRVPQNGTWDGQIPTDQLWLYLNEVEVAHCHDSMGDTDAWGKLLWVSESPAQGWDVWLGCDRECKLQSCFGEGAYEVRMVR